MEELICLGRALRSVKDSYKTILVDCLTLWMSNLFFEYPDQDETISEIVDDFFLSIDKFEETIIIVSNELGMGIVPENKLARVYRDSLGFLNQRIAGRADEVYMLFSGIPVRIK
ncbi:MAG: bifunctional adenosylcobinamide kinase/adenosylcobinamide-phosphate guanylyltransferase [Deltaproteobacteria bacterium]|nr:bifunctional adenosylcobinamide kinase/adenosylcobinamide-phosphate guanylyltransferase [Deltaproteobacteria bacterium]